MILKPDPGNPVELYLGSLEALGIDTRANDVRLVEDDWKSPALGANGLGWEIWLNGQVRLAPLSQPVGPCMLDIYNDSPQQHLSSATQIAGMPRSHAPTSSQLQVSGGV